MLVVLDGAEIVFQRSIAETVDVILNAMKNNQRFLKTAIANGEEVNLKEFVESNPPTQSLKLEIYSATFDELIEDTMSSCHEFVPKLIRGMQFCVQLLSDGEDEKALDVFQDLISGLKWNISVIGNFATMSPRRDAGICLIYDRSVEITNHMNEAFEHTDSIMLKDVLQFEMLPWMHEWHRFIQLFQSQIHAEKVRASVHGK